MKRRILSIFLATILFLVSSVFFYVGKQDINAAQTFQKVNYISGVVTANALNMRKGPSTKHEILTVLTKNKWVNILAKMGDWYVVYDPETDMVGCAHGDYISPPGEDTPKPTPMAKSTPMPKATSTPSMTSTPAPDNMTPATMSEDEKKLLNLINNERAKAGLAALTADPELMDVARLKAKDMVENNYFSHQSPKYGSPFDMMKQFGISFRTAGENIAGNSTEEGAVTAWMNSEGHRKNILSGNFNYTGVGIYNSPKYGKVFVQMFIGR